MIEAMDVADVQDAASSLLHFISFHLQRIPGSAIVIRYIRSSYQNDPFRSAIELLLLLFAIRYLLAPSYSRTKNKGYAELTEEVGRATGGIAGRAPMADTDA